MSAGLKYFFSKDHTWAAQSEDGLWLVGITDYAQNMLGDVVFVDPPKNRPVCTASQCLRFDRVRENGLGYLCATDWCGAGN